MSTLGYRQGSGEAIPAIIHPSYVAGGQTWTVLSGVKKDVLNTVHKFVRFSYPPFVRLCFWGAVFLENVQPTATPLRSFTALFIFYHMGNTTISC